MDKTNLAYSQNIFFGVDFKPIPLYMEVFFTNSNITNKMEVTVCKEGKEQFRNNFYTFFFGIET